jgi:hypothetical protein
LRTPIAIFTDYYFDEFYRAHEIEADSNQPIAGSPEQIGMAVLISSSTVPAKQVPVYTPVGVGIPPRVSGIIFDVTFVDMKLGTVVGTKRFEPVFPAYVSPNETTFTPPISS